MGGVGSSKRMKSFCGAILPTEAMLEEVGERKPRWGRQKPAADAAGRSVARCADHEFELVLGLCVESELSRCDADRTCALDDDHGFLMLSDPASLAVLGLYERVGDVRGDPGFQDESVRLLITDLAGDKAERRKRAKRALCLLILVAAVMVDRASSKRLDCMLPIAERTSQ